MSSAFWKIKGAKVTKDQVFKTIIETPDKSIRNLETGLLKVDRMKAESRKTGFSWSIEQLRLKSDIELQKLWYVLLKQKITIKSDLYHASQFLILPRGLKEEENKILLSMNRIKSLHNYRTNLANNTLALFEFFQYKKTFYKEQFDLKFPNKTNIEEPMFSNQERKRLNELSENIELIKKIHGISKSFEISNDFIELRSKVPNDFNPKDTFFLFEVFNNKEVKSILEMLNKVKMAFKDLSSNKINSINIILYNEEVVFNSAVEAKVKLYAICKDYLDLASKLMNEKIKVISEKIKNNEYADLTSQSIIDSLDRNKDYLLREINLEYYYIEILNNKESEYLDIEITSKLIDNDIKRILIYPINQSKLNSIKLINSNANNTSSTVSVLSDSELQAVENLKMRTSVMSLLPMYVDNTDQLRAKSKKKLLYEIQRGRAKIAKDIFLKELSALSYKAKNMDKDKYQRDINEIKAKAAII